MTTELISPVDDNPNAPFPFGFTEFKDSGEEDYAWIEGKFEATRIFDGPWENRLDFIVALSWQVYEVDGQQVLFPPAFHPEIKGIYAVKARVKGLLKTDRNTATNYIKHDIARITVTYDSTPIKGLKGGDGDNKNGTDPYIEEGITSSVNIIPIKISIPQWTGDTQSTPVQSGDPVVGYDPVSKLPLYPHYTPPETIQDFTELKEVSFNKRIVTINYKLRIPLVLKPVWDIIRDCLGCVNELPFTTPSGLVAAPETLLYEGLSGITKRELLNGDLGWELEHSFNYYKPGWNTRPQGEYSGTGNSFIAVVKDVEIVPHLYESNALQALLRNLSTDEKIAVKLLRP